MKQLLRGARTLGPYLLTEALLPGGTLIALGLWLYQNKERLPLWIDRATLRLDTTLIALLLWLFRRKFAVNGQIEQGLAAPARY